MGDGQLREKEQLSNSAKSSMLESLLPVVDNFELAKGSIKCETEGEEKINGSYQNMYKQVWCSNWGCIGSGFKSGAFPAAHMSPPVHSLTLTHISLSLCVWQMVETFRGLGLTAVPTIGEMFNPEVHEALMREPTADAEEGTVIKVRERDTSLSGKTATSV